MSEQIAYALYFLPGDEEMKLITGMAEEVTSLLDAGVLKSGFVFAPYEASKEYPKLLIRSQVLISGEECISHSFSQIGGATTARLEDDTSVCMSQKIYEKAVGGLVDELKGSKDFKKAVLARALEAELPSDFSTLTLLKKMKAKMPNAFCFLVNTPQAGIWMGATPERLLEVNGEVAFTNALAGTLPADSDQDWSEKERVEQQIVTDYIAEQLDDVGVENYKKSDAETIVSGTVKHLRTSFEFELENAKNIESVIEALHPTPAVCGMPLEAAKAAIEKYEYAPRKYYTGYLGPWGVGADSHLFVNLRSMQVGKEKAVLYVGAGITEDSVPEKEWEETEVKAQTLLSVIK